MTGIILFRAQPFHLGHLSQIKRAFKDIRELDQHLYIIVGSADKMGTKRNPLPIELRLDLINNVIQEEFSYKERQYIHVKSLNDLSDESHNTHEWGNYLYKNICDITKDNKFMLYYSDKPDIMLSWFSDEILNNLAFKFLPRYNDISATLVRNHIINFKEDDRKKLLTYLPTYVYGRIEEIRNYILKAEEPIENNIKKIKDDCVKWIKDWFEENGPDCSAVIGISGGKDSSVAAALCVEALGARRVIGVLMPKTFKEDKDKFSAIRLCQHLEIDNVTMEIDDILKSFEDALDEGLMCSDLNLLGGEWSLQSSINLQPRVRMAMLYAVAQNWNGRVCNTSNLSERYIGYSTRWGDSVGDFAPLANLTSEEVSEIGKYCGLPEELSHKIPSDGLCGKTDEENLGFTYTDLNKYILTGHCENKETLEKINKLHNQNLFKLKPIPKFELNGREVI